MRSTDDYLIVTEKAEYTTRIAKSLIDCARDHDFIFNKKKLKSNFELEGFHLEQSKKDFKWIGKTLTLQDFEIEHT